MVPQHRPDRSPGTRTIEIPDVGVVLLEKSKRAKRLILSVRPKRVRVAVPYRISFQKAEEFARANKEWIRERLKEQSGRCVLNRELKAGLAPLDRKEARAHLVPRLEELAAYHGFTFNRVSIRDQKSRWGSCSSKGNINLNMRLVHLPAELQDYVLLHELTHTRVPNHSLEFWSQLKDICPNARELKRELREYHYCLSE